MAAKKKKEVKGPRYPPRSARALAARHRLSSLRIAEPTDEQTIDAARDQWRLEVFWEGYRVVATRLDDDVAIFADDMREWTGPAAAIALALKDVPVSPFVVEGWLCVLDDRGRPDFELLKSRMTTGKGPPLVFMVSDVRVLGAEPLEGLSLAERRAKLSAVLPSGHRTLLPPQELDGTVKELKRSLEDLWLRAFLARPERGEHTGLVISVDDEPVPLNRSLSAAPKVTNSDKVLFPRDGFTKSDLVAWYRDIAPVLLTHMQGRPVVAQRWPDGIDEFTWFQHRAPPRAPDYLRSTRIEGDRRILIENEDALLWMVNQAALTFHGWASRVGSLAHPDWAIVDLDPGTNTTWAQTIEIAQAVRALLELLEVKSVVKTSGQKGLHVLIPLAPGHTAAEATEFARGVCSVVARLKPQLASLEAETGPRRGRLFLDFLQNYEGKTLVLPWSVRAADGAPVSMPLQWSEVTPSLDPKAFTIRTARKRLDAMGDLFAPALTGTLKLAPVLTRLRATHARP